MSDTQRVAIVVLSDPKSGSEEAVGRVFGALSAAHEFRSHGDEVQVIFQGTATRWLEVLSNEEHPINGLFNEVKDSIAGASSG